VRLLVCIALCVTTLAYVSATPNARPAAAAGITYIGRVGSATSASSATSAALVVKTPGAQAGQTLLVALLLSSTSSLTGAVTAADSAGNVYSVDRDVNDGSDGDRALVLSARNVRALAAGNTISLTFPTSAEYHVSIDEFGGVAALDRSAGAFGRTSSFNSGATTTTAQPNELLFGLVGVESGSTPSFSAGWNALPALSVSTDWQRTGYQISGTTGQFAATGSTTGTWMAAIATYTPSSAPPPPTDAPPVAALKVTPATGPTPLTVTADATGSTDTDTTPIANYKFNFGDGSPIVGPQTTLTAAHTYTTTGTFTVTLTATDTAGLTGTTTATVTVTAASSSGLVVYAGYYDTHHPGNPQPKPSPWQGSPWVVFVGQPDSSSGGWDSSAVRVDNVSGIPQTVTVTVDVGTHHIALWGTNTIPAGGILILTQMGLATFDGSDFNPGGCYGCSAATCTPPMTTIPVVHVTIGTTIFNYNDTGQVINTHGVDSAGCPYNGNRNDESEPWTQLAGP
jgi:PKD repeat protein